MSPVNQQHCIILSIMHKPGNKFLGPACQNYRHQSMYAYSTVAVTIMCSRAIAVEGEQNAVDHCGNDGNFLPYSAIFILFTVHYYFDT